MLVEQDIAEVTVYRRSESWQPSYYYLGEEVLFESIGSSVHVEDIYEHVKNGDLAKWRLEKSQEEIRE